MASGKSSSARERALSPPWRSSQPRADDAEQVPRRHADRGRRCPLLRADRGECGRVGTRAAHEGVPALARQAGPRHCDASAGSDGAMTCAFPVRFGQVRKLRRDGLRVRPTQAPLDPACAVASDGLQCFASVTEAGCHHRLAKAGSGPAAAHMPAFKGSTPRTATSRLRSPTPIVRSSASMCRALSPSSQAAPIADAISPRCFRACAGRHAGRAMPFHVPELAEIYAQSDGNITVCFR